jgi:hypothetical protein
VIQLAQHHQSIRARVVIWQRARIADGRRRQCRRRLGGRGGSSVLGYGASDTGAVVAFEDNVLSNSDFLIDGSTTGSNGTYVAGDPTSTCTPPAA